MNVYLLMEEYPFDGATVLGIFLNKSDAETQRDIAVKKDASNGYTYYEYNIEEHEVK